MPSSTSLLGLLKIKKPIFLAPMAGGVSTPELAAAVSNAGGLGSLGLAYSTADEIRTILKATQKLTTHSLAANLFVPEKNISVTEAEIQKAILATSKYRKELDIHTTPDLHPPYNLDFDQQFDAILEMTPALFTFCFGLISKDHIKECKKRNIAVAGTATSADEGLLLQELGVDIVIAQGIEAGGHRGLFSATDEDPKISCLELTKVLVEKLHLPVVAAGALMTFSHVQMALQIGAQATQHGTAFLLAKEAGTSKPYRKALLSKDSVRTKTTRAFSGRLARGIENRFMTEMDKSSADILPFPVQNAFTRDIRKKAAELDRSEFLTLWAGTEYQKAQEGSAQDIVELLYPT